MLQKIKDFLLYPLRLYTSTILEREQQFQDELTEAVEDKDICRVNELIQKRQGRNI